MRIIMAFLILLLPMAASAQGAATLVADTITVSNSNTLTAQGNVQVFYNGTSLSAESITYSQQSDRLIINGPIYIRTSDGTVITAQRAELDPTLENGILLGARLVLDQRLQLAANQISRIDGRYSQMTRSVATSCQICGDRPPLWEIRADRIIHNEQERQLYFDNATFLIRGMPVLWLPRMRLPDPTLERATGLLIPRVRTNNLLGVGLRLPYFIRIGDSRDITLTPYFSRETTTLEARYRQAFINGTLEVNAAYSRDSILPGEARAYLFANGEFDLGSDYQLSFDIEAVTDPAYLLNYGYSDKDRLDSAITLQRIRENDLLIADFTRYDSLRDDEVDAQLPPFVASILYEYRSTPELLGGTLTLGTSLDAFERTSSVLGDDGRDVARLSGSADWQRSWILPAGVLLNARTSLDIDYYNISQDPAYENGFRASPSVSATLRWPLMHHTSNGTLHVVEPIVSLGWSKSYGVSVPNEDGTLAEFDEANLFALSRFPGQDALETGSRTAIGVVWTRIAGTGETASLTFGRVYQQSPQTGFSPSSGLSQQTSDWLLSGSLELNNGFNLNARTLFDDNFDFDKTEARVNWSNARLDLAAAYHFLPRDPTRDRDEAASEWSFDATYRIDRSWTIRLDGRYDVIAEQPARAGLGIGWQNECVTVDLSVSRRYTSSDTVKPSTSFGMAVNLTGFSSGRIGNANPRSCNN